jgi:hypothetical protein
LACSVFKKRSENMSTITRSISIDFNNARYVREKAACFKEAADAETRPDVAVRLYKQVAFLEHEGITVLSRYLKQTYQDTEAAHRRAGPVDNSEYLGIV